MTLQRLTYSVREAAETLGISESQLRREIKAGHIKHLRFGKRVIIPKQVIADMLAAAKG